MANGRLAKDVQYLQRHIQAYFNGQAAVTDVDDNLSSLELDILPSEGFYRGAKLRFRVRFDPDLYPSEPPVVICLDKVYHPNIDTTDWTEMDTEDIEAYENTNVCVSLLDEWDSNMGLDHVVMSILFLMYNPNPEDALSPYFDSESIEDFTEAVVRQTLKGGTYEGVKFPRLLIDDSDCDEDVCEKVNEESEAGSQTVNNKDSTESTAEVCQGNAALVETEISAGSMQLSELNEAAFNRDNSALGCSDLIMAKASKAELVCNRQNWGLTELNCVLASTFKTVKNECAAATGYSDVDGISAATKVRSRSLTFGECLLTNPQVGTLFSNFLQMPGNMQMERIAPALISTEGEVD